MAVAATLADVRPDVVYHLGGWSDVCASWDHPNDAFQVNATGTLNLLQACRASGGPRVLAVSSADVYGRVRPDELPITEDAPFRPVTPYAASKIAADQLGLQAWLGYGLEVIRVRAFNHLGPGQATAFVAPALAERIALNERDGSDMVPVGNLTPRRDITDVHDVVRAYRLLMTHGEPGEAYNVCTGRDLSIGELAEHLVALAAHPMRLEPDPALQRHVETPVLRGDNTNSDGPPAGSRSPARPDPRRRARRAPGAGRGHVGLTAQQPPPGPPPVAAVGSPHHPAGPEPALNTPENRSS